MRVALGVVSVLGAVAFLAIGGGKIVSTATFVEQLGLPAALVVVIGLLEVAGALGLLAGLRVRAIGLAASVGLLLLLLGAVGFHVLRGDLVPAGTSALVLLVVAGALTALHVISARTAPGARTPVTEPAREAP
ncbi:DoxX family protein [Pseudonocardia sp. ICBG601]|uniref:DoxX family protein n=1 Tax=Pseudonocardia sp. ICBG601 TaxID=2846759 RepID=UPI001CF64BD7|nr:DoxX family protein [Pseudonocardia sp. ICBG601]